MNINDILKITFVVFLISLCFLALSASLYLVDRVIHPEYKYNIELVTDDTIAHQVEEAIIDTGLAGEMEDIKESIN